MGNPVRPWINFLTAWEKLDLTGQSKLISDARRMLTQLKTHRKDIDERITYWENNLSMARSAKRRLEWNGRSRERHQRGVKGPVPMTRGKYKSRFAELENKVAKKLAATLTDV